MVILDGIMAATNSPGQFPLTQWSLVARAGGEDPNRRLTALEELLRRYLPALKAHLISVKRLPPEQADDLLQSFIADKIIQGQLLGQADPQRGRFRTILLTALDRYAVSLYRRDAAQKRAPDGGFVALEDFDVAAGGGASVGSEGDVEWARQVIAEALRRAKAECASGGRAACWGMFDVRVVGPLLRGEEPPPYEELIRRFGFESPLQASNALTTAKRIFSRTLREVVGEYANPETELAELRAILSQAGE